MESPYIKCPFPSLNISNKINFQELYLSKQIALAPVCVERFDDIPPSTSSKEESLYLEHFYEKYNSNVYIVSCVESNGIYNSETGV